MPLCILHILNFYLYHSIILIIFKLKNVASSVRGPVHTKLGTLSSATSLFMVPGQWYLLHSSYNSLVLKTKTSTFKDINWKYALKSQGESL